MGIQQIWPKAARKKPVHSLTGQDDAPTTAPEPVLQRWEDYDVYNLKEFSVKIILPILVAYGGYGAQDNTSVGYIAHHMGGKYEPYQHARDFA